MTGGVRDERANVAAEPYPDGEQAGGPRTGAEMVSDGSLERRSPRRARARARIASTVDRTPLVRLHLDGAPAEIWLKLECLQPIGSFKLRGAANAILDAPRAELAAGLVTTSTGNMAQGVAWMARELGVPATIVVPDSASMGKLAAVERLGLGRSELIAMWDGLRLATSRAQTVRGASSTSSSTEWKPRGPTSGVQIAAPAEADEGVSWKVPVGIAVGLATLGAAVYCLLQG